MTGKKGQSLKQPADDYSRRKQGFRREQQQSRLRDLRKLRPLRDLVV